MYAITRRAASLLAVLVLIIPLAGGQTPRSKTDPPPQDEVQKTLDEGTFIEVHFNDDGRLKMKLLDDKIELATPNGKLAIPTADIRRIEFATRIPDDVLKRIDTAIDDLGNDDFATREAASSELHTLGAAAYHALLKAAKSPDAEVKRRVEDLLAKLRKEVPQDRLEFRPNDVVHTDNSKITGRISASSLKVKTAQFGDLQMKLTDVRSCTAGLAARDTTSTIAEGSVAGSTAAISQTPCD